MPSNKKVVVSNRAPQAIGPYSQAIRTRDLIFLSGQIPLDPDTGQLNANQDIKAQTERVLLNLQGILEAEQLSLEHVVKTTVFLTNLTDFAVMNEVYAKFFPAAAPARSTVQVAALPKGARIEIEAVAVCS